MREEGYYFVKRKGQGKMTVATWFAGYWGFFFDPIGYEDSELSIIGPKIEMPS